MSQPTQTPLKWAWCAIMIAVMVCLTAPALAEIPDPIARVNRVPIPKARLVEAMEDLEKRFASFGGNLPADQVARFEQRVIDRLIEDELLEQHLTKSRIRATKAEIDAEVDKALKASPYESLELLLEKTGMTEADLRTDLKRRLRLEKLLSKNGGLDVSEKDIETYYNDNLQRFEIKEQVTASHILVKVPKNADEETVRTARKKINDIYREATKPGADFAEVAKKYSEGPSAPRGGDLGSFTRGRMVKPFEDAAFATPVGQVSKPLKTVFGWHILIVHAREDARTKPLQEVRQDISTRLKAQKFRDARQALLDKLHKAARIKRFYKPGN